MTESDYQQIVCPGMEIEVVLPDGARVDCVSETHAIEIDLSNSGRRRSVRPCTTPPPPV